MMMRRCPHRAGPLHPRVSCGGPAMRPAASRAGNLPTDRGGSMDPSAFDALIRAFASGGTRRRLLRLVTALPFGGALLVGEDAAGAERPHERLGRRTRQRNRKQ